MPFRFARQEKDHMLTHAADPSEGLIEPLDIAPLRKGPLDGLRFTVKDIIDLAGYRTSYGSPAWRGPNPVPGLPSLPVKPGRHEIAPGQSAPK